MVDDLAARRTVPAVPILLILAPLCVAGAAVTVLAARRSVAQPVALADDAEVTFLAHILATPATIALCGLLDGDHFASPRHAALWRELRTHAAITFHDDEPAARAQMVSVPADLAGRCTDRDLVADLLRRGACSESEALDAGMRILEAGDDRLVFGSQAAGELRPGGPGEATLVRTYRRPGPGRVTVGALLGLCGAAAAAHADVSALATLSLGVLLLGSIVWALVDFDTLYVDYPTMAIFGGGAWALGALDAVLAGEPGRIMIGVLGAAAVAGSFELANYAFKKVRGIDGLGGGDAVIVLATVGVPALVTGSGWVAYASTLSALLLAIAGWVVLRVRRGATAHTPFALGPYLALGWIVALFIVTGGTL